MIVFDELKNAYGNHFQDLFSELMMQRYGLAYKPTSTSGNNGDFKVDGVLHSTAFAVYAPETYNDNKTIKKLKEDFNGFLFYKNKGCWVEIEKYIFVVKRERSGITSTVLNLISNFKKDFPVDIWTIDDLRYVYENYLPFSDDDKLLCEFKNDVTYIMEYIKNTDFTSVPFDINLPTVISERILPKWENKKYQFNNQNIESLKKEILTTLNNLLEYLTPLYVHAFNGHLLLFNNDSVEAGERLRNDFQPNVFKIRKEMNVLLNKLWEIKI